jgi:universal stress protein E
MTAENRILVVVDPTASNKQVCVERAAWLATNLDLDLELLICHYEQILPGARSDHAAFIERSQEFAIGQQRKKLEEIARPLRERGLGVIVSAVWDKQLGDGIVRHVLRTNPRMLVKDTHYHSIISRAIFTNTDWHLVRTCPVPLWLTKPHAWPSTARIVASVDPGHEHDIDASLDATILNEATMLSENLSGELHAFHAYLPISAYNYTSINAGISPIDNLDEKIEQDHQKLLDDLLDGYSVSTDRTHMTAGDPAKLLPKLATDLDAGLVVMGAIARNPLQRVFVGSTTEQVLDKLPCDLLIVKPDWYSTSVMASTPEYYEGTRKELPIPRDPIAEELEHSDNQAV